MAPACRREGQRVAGRVNRYEMNFFTYTSAILLGDKNDILSRHSA
jgi:hypothetical protein